MVFSSLLNDLFGSQLGVKGVYIVTAWEPAHFFGQERENKEAWGKRGGRGGGEEKMSLDRSHCIQ